MRVSLTLQVQKLAQQERIPNQVLCRAAREVVAGVLGSGEADLGGGLFKKRLARSGGGKSGGYRAIIACRSPNAGRVLYACAFAKAAASALTPQGHDVLCKVAGSFFRTDEVGITALLAVGDITEIECDEEA